MQGIQDKIRHLIKPGNIRLAMVQYNLPPASLQVCHDTHSQHPSVCCSVAVAPGYIYLLFSFLLFSLSLILFTTSIIFSPGKKVYSSSSLRSG